MSKKHWLILPKLLEKCSSSDISASSDYTGERSEMSHTESWLSYVQEVGCSIYEDDKVKPRL